MAPVQETEDNTSCPAGASKRLECQVIGLPRPSVRWYKDGVNITTNKRYQFEYTPDGFVVLVLENVTARDQGVYSCRAQNSEGSAETVAQLYIKGTMSEAGGDTPSIHTMPSLKKVENENEMTSQSQMRPLVLGKSSEPNNEPQSVDEEAAGMKDNDSFSEGEEKGTLEIKQQKPAKKHDTGDETENACSESDEETQKNDELSNVVEDLLELTKFGNSGRRLTTDSGITSRGSSFSSEPDINITEESIQEMKEYLHGKADALYQPFEHDKVKDIKESETEIVIARSEKLASNEKAEHLKSQIMSMTSLRQEKYDTDRVNEIEASVLAGMYLFDTGPSGKVDECRHGIPALELLVRKEALEAIPDNERGSGKFDKLNADSIENAEKEKSHTRLEYQTAEIIQESKNGENNEVEILNAINIEKNSEAVRIHDEVKYTKIKTVRYVEEGVEGEEGREKSSGGQENLNTLAEDRLNDEIRKLESDRNSINAETYESIDNIFLSADNIDEQEVHAGTTTAFKDKDIATDEICQGILSESNEVKYFDDIEGVLERENKVVGIETVKYGEESGKGKENTSGDQEILSTLTEFGSNNRMSLEHDKNNQDTEILKTKEEIRIDKSKRDKKTDNELEDQIVTNLIGTDADIANASSKDAVDKVNVISSSSDINSDEKPNDEKDYPLDFDANSKTSASKNKEDNQNTADNQCEISSNLESDRDIIYADTCENKVNRFLSADNKAEDEFDVDTTTASKEKGITNDEKCQGSLSESIKVNYFDDIEGVLEHEKTEMVEIETVRYVEEGGGRNERASDDKENQNILGQVGHENEMVENNRNFARGGSFDHNEVQNETSNKMRKPEISGLLDHEQADGSGGKIDVSKDMSVSEDSREIDKRQGYELENHVKQERNITEESDGLQIDVPTSTATDSETRVKDKNSSYFEAVVAKKKSDPANSLKMIADSSIDSLDENINDSSLEVDSGVYTENEEAKATDDIDTCLASDVHNVGNIITNGSPEAELGFSSTTFPTENGTNIAGIDVVKNVVTDDAELRLIEENFEMKSSPVQDLTLNDLNAIKNKSIETHVSENSENMNESVVTVENEFRQHSAEMKQIDKVNEHTAVLRKSKETMLYSADENSDSGREFSEPLKDTDLVRIEDTKPQIPNIINIQYKMKQKEIKAKDASLTEEIENRGMSLKAMSEDPSIISAKQTTAANGLLVVSADEINLAPWELIRIESSQMVQHEETAMIRSKSIIGEYNEVSVKNDGGEGGAKELVVNKILNEEAEVSEQKISQKANTESKVPDLDKLNNAGFVEMKKEVCEQQVIPENTHKESKVPDLENLCNAEKVTEGPEQTLQSNAPSHKVDEECIVPESVNKDNATPNICKTDKLGEKTSEPKTYPTEGKSEPIVEVLIDDTNVRVNEGFPVKLRWKIRGVALSEVNICKSGQKVGISDNLYVDISNDVISLIVDNVTISDDATYSVRIRESEKDYGEVKLKVHTSVSSEGKESTVAEEPQFVVEPVVDVEYGRRLSVKCSVTGFPAPEVTWYCQGQQLSQDALWDIYSKDGYHYLGVGDPSVLDCEEIVCRVENDLGYVQRVVRVKRDGDEVYCEPVLPPVSPEPSEVTESSPSIEIDISEIVTANLRQLPLAEEYTDRLNFVMLNAGDVIEVLACEAEGTVLARSMPQRDKVCYIPIKALSVSDDVSSQVCENAAIKNNSQLTEQQLHQNKEEATMPERRKMKSPSPKMTSTPKMKRKEVDTESTEELQKRLGFSDNLAQKKEFSTKDSVEFTEYNDGTTRPMFKKRLKSVTAKTGEMAQLECTVSGSPLPKILWLKNNRPLKASDGCKVIVDEGTNILVFPQAREEDVGIYTARAMNVNGSIMCSAEFSLSDGSGVPAQPVTDSPIDMDFTTPAYFFQMSSCEVTEGRLARFDCRVVAYPKPEIVWMRDGKVVEAEERFKLLNFNNEIYSLLIQNVQIEDTGRYTCWARNKFGEAMTEAYLNVIALTEQEPDGDIAPKFLTRFYDKQTTEGTSTDFKCLIAGRPEPSVTWLLDDLEIREDKGLRMRHKDGMVSLEIKSSQVDQSGTYTCQLNNPLGEAKCSARLTVVEDKLHGKMLPKFLKKFDHVTAKEGEEAKFTSVIVGEPRPDVMWLFDHKPISDTNRRFQMKKEGDAYTLIIKNVRFDDGGKITCKASNEEGEVYCSANLHVRESKYMRDMPEKTGVKGQDELDSSFGYVPTFTRRLQDLEVKEGSKATFECKVMGIPDPEISWMKDGRVISPGGRHHMTLEGGTGQLVIDNVTAADTGVYTCIVSNSQGKSSSTAALKLEEPKKERYTPDRLLEERTSRKERYTPDKYLLDDTTSAKRPYLDTDRYDKYDKYDAKVKKSYESPLASTKLEDSYVPRSKKKYDSPKSSYDSYKPKYDTSFESPKLSFESPKLSFESPLRQYDSTYARLESPVRQFDTYKRYESPVRQYEGVSTKYESPVRPYESISTRYESPVRPYESISTRYESPVRQYEGKPSKYESPVRPYESISTRYESPVRAYDAPRGLYESPRRRSSVGREERIKAVPKIPFDRPALLNKREDSVQLSWLPAPTYDLPDDARHISYVVESREVPSRDWTKVTSSVPGTSYTIRHLRPDKEYEFRVRAQNQHGASEPTWNATLDKRVDETSKQLDLPEMRAPPRLPTHRPIITDLGEETLRLAWRPVETYQSKRTPPVSYRLEAKELPGKDWMPLSSRLRDTTHYLSELPHDRDYMIRVRAENDFGISEPTEPLWLPRATAFPGVPVTRPEIIDYEDTRAKLSWSRVDIPAFGMGDAPLLYMLEVEEPPHKDWRTIARDLDDTEYIVEGLRPGHDYRFRVRAKTPTGIVSEPSPAVSLYTKLAQTRAPVDRLQVLEYEPDSRSVNLSWDRVNIPPYNMDEEPLMYMLEYQEPPLPEWKTLVTGIPTTRYRVMHLDRERDYNFRVRALTHYGVSPPSPAVPVTMRQTPVTRGLPEKVIISEVEPHSLQLTWRRPMYDLDKPINYQVEMLEYPFSDWRPIASRVVETTYKVTGLKPTRDYQFRVIPQVDSGYLAPSPSAALTTMPVKPRLPYTEPKLKELTPESVQLSWGSAEMPAYQRKRSPIHYKVEMAELPSSNWVPVARKVPDTTFNVTGLRANQEYKFRVFAESDSGLSEPSMPVSLYRKPAPKFTLKEPSIRDISQNIVHLAWTPAEIPDNAASLSYMVEMQTPPGISTWSVLHRKHPSPSVRLADLRPDLDYLVRVRAQSGSYLSEPTLPVYIPRRAAPPRLPVEEPYAVDINADYVKLQWRSAELPTHIQDYAPISYRLEAQELPDTNWVAISRGIPHTDFKVTGLNPQRDYNFRVRAENEYGLSDPTHPMMLRKRSVAPVMPVSEPLLYDVGSGSARLSWRPATYPSFVPSQSPITYTLFVQELPFKTWRPLVKRIPHTSYYVSGLQPDKEYRFRVQAENQFGSSKPTESVLLPHFKDFTRPISVPEVSDFDEDLTSVKLRWSPTRVSPPFDTTPRKYTVETWEPVRREWKPVARGVPDTTYQIRELPKLPDHLFRVRMDTEEPTLSEPSLPVSLSRYRLPRAPMYRPQLYEVDDDSVRLSWQPVHVPEGVSRRSVRYTIEQREIPEPLWSPVASDLMETSYKVRGLRSKCDYEFRVKALYDGTSTEPSYPVSLYRRAVIPKVKFDAPEVYDVEDSSLSLRWNTVDVPAFTNDEEPLLFVIERQTLPSYEWQPVADNITDKTYTVRDLQPYQDYNFRVRGVYPSGYTEPSPYVPVYRRPINLSVPVARTEVWEEEPSSARLRWHRAYIPRYYSSTPISYRVEMQEAGGTDTEWKSVARDIKTPDYTVRNISPRKDYRFRIRAQTENGDISEPTPPIQFYRTRVPLLKDSENALAEFKPVEYKAIFLKHPYYEQLTKYVPPTMPIHKPDMIIIDQETIELSWRPAIVAEAIRGTCNLTYTIEVRCPPSFEWRQLVTGLKICSHTVQKLHPRIDYIFRIRAWNEYGCSDAGLPVSLYRPAVYKIEGEDMDDEEFEREWERKYGTKVPPKLPIDTPRIVTQTSDSIWFTWLPARIPAYATQTNISYVVEIREPPSTAWQRDATELVDCQYVKEGLNPNQEYHIRVRAETEFGPSDATMPIIIRGKGSRPGSRRSSVERDERSLEDKIDLSYFDNVMAGVPPRMASSRPLSSNVGPDKLTLTWSPCRTPSYVKATNVTYTYTIEKREPPGHVWTVLAKDITAHKFDITGLNPEQDYMFRVRARNEFGLSEPTLPMTLFRDRDDYVPPRVRSRSSSRDSISMLVSKVMRRSSSIDYSKQPMEDDRSSQERIPCQPQYITTYDTQYGVLGKKGKIQLEVRGYPLPTVHWYIGEEKIEYGGRFNAFVTPTGGITLEIKNVGLDTVGQFKCYAENASGAAVKMVNFELAEPPTVLGTIKDISVLKGDSATLTCQVDGFPSPTVKWMKDWRPLADCTRTKMVNVPPETFNLEIVQLIEEDDGLYACTVENIAGKVTVTGRLKVEIDSFPESEINIKSTPIEEHYHVLEEIGRGRYGVVRRVVEISTGRTFAANFMSMRNKAQKNFFLCEYEVLRSISKMGGVLKLYDAFETERSLIFVTEILSEPELLEKIITDGMWTEAKVAATIKRLLAILQELAQLNILHLDIKPSNIRMSGSDLDDIKLIGFGLSRTLKSEEDVTHNYGSVGYASPEQVTNEILKPNTDMWSVGVLAYLLLSGNGPFTGSSEIEILNYMSDCSWTFEGRGFEKFSKEGLDFISKLLVKDPSKRMTVEECLTHPWMSTQSETKINTEQLKQFYNAEKLQRQTEKVFTTVQLQSFAKIIHGAKALYQPAVDIESGEIIFPDSDMYGDYLDEDAWYEWQLQYLDDPDSQIFPIQDKKFTVRECRHAGAPKYSTPKQKERADKDILDTGTGVLFRDKIQPTTFLVGEDVTFRTKVVSETGEIPVVTWYRDEQLLSDDYRADASFNPDTGLAKLKIVNSKDYDAAVYKCVARVKEGRVSCEARLFLGDVPSKPGRPFVTQTSGTEAFLTWSGPVADGNAYLLGYRVDYRKEGEKKWTQGPYVTEEYALLTGLEPDTKYVFRASVHNKYGASPFSWSSLETKTLGKDAPKVSVAADLRPLMQFSTFDKQQLILPAESRRPSLTVVEEPKVNESDPNENFTFADVISKGSYGEYKLCTNKSTNQQCVAKIVPYNKDKHANITAEFELLRTMRQSNLVTVLDSYISGDQFYVIYEFLSGINIVQYLCLHKTYKEETVARLVRQVLDALQYLEHFGIVHLNLQPSSMVMATRRRPHVKLRDFTLVQKVEDDKGVKVPLAGYPDYTPPEIIKGENVTFTADLWTVGALTFTLLSGISPFGGKNLEETLSRILFDRYSTKEMYDNVTEESVKFVVKLLSRLARNRPTVTKCLNSSWLNLSESMVNARNSRMFKSEKLRAFSEDYLGNRSDINYSLALVDIEKLPKITSGPLIQPILSDKITNRLENLTKVKTPPTNLAESLKTELSNLPEQPLIEKLVNKIEKDTEISEKVEDGTVEYQKVAVEEDISGKAPEAKDQSDMSEVKEPEMQEVTDVEANKTTVTKIDSEQMETKELDSEIKEEVVEYQKIQVEEAAISQSQAIKEKAKDTEMKDQLEKVEIKEMVSKELQESADTRTEDSVIVKETKITETVEEVKESKTEGTEIKEEKVEKKAIDTGIEKEVVESNASEVQKAGEAIITEVKEHPNVADTTEANNKPEIATVKGTESKEDMKETKHIDTEIVQSEDKKLKSTDEIKEKDISVTAKTLTEKGVIQIKETEEKLDSVKAVEDKIENKIEESIANNKEIENKVDMSEAEGEEKWHDALAEIEEDIENEKLTDLKEKEEKMKTEDTESRNEENLPTDNEIEESQQDKLIETTKQTEALKQEAEEEFKETVETHEKKEILNEGTEESRNEKIMRTKEGAHVNEQTKTIEERKDDETKLTKTDTQADSNDSTDGKETTLEGEHKELEKIETVENIESKVDQQNENKEAVEEEIESVKVDKKDITIFKSEKTESETVKEVVVSEHTESTKTINEISETAAEEIKKAALEEVAAILKASKESEQAETQEQIEQETSQLEATEETIRPELKKSSEEEAFNKVQVDKLDKTEVDVPAKSDTADVDIEKGAASVDGEKEKVDVEIKSETAEDKIKIENKLDGNVSVELSEHVKMDLVDKTDEVVIEQKENSVEQKKETVNKGNESVVDNTGTMVDTKKEISDSKSCDNENVKNEMKTESVTKVSDSLQDEIKRDTDEKLEEEHKMKEGKTGKEDAVCSVSNVEEKESSQISVSAKESLIETTSEKLSEVIDSAATITQEKSVSSVTEESTATVSAKNEIDETVVSESVIAKQESSVESISTPINNESISESEMKLADAVVKETAEKQVTESTSVTATKKEIDEPVVTELVDAIVKETIEKQATESTIVTETEATKNERDETVVTESVIAKQESSVESISMPDNNKSISESEIKLADAVVKETVEKQITESTSVTTTEENATVSSMSVKEETHSASVSKQVDAITTETVSVTQKHETLTSGGETMEGIENVNTMISKTEELVQESSSVVESSESSKVSVSEKRETLTTCGETVESLENISTVTTTKEEHVQDSTNVESSESMEVSQEQRQETLISGSMVSDINEDVEMVSTSLVEESVVESAVSSSLETAKVTESRETVREFMTNDLEIEEMKKELLEDLEISSAECGKYLLGSHEDLSSIKEKIEKKPDEEEIEKETTNRYIDDALMFC